ncbi:MAG: hypothetical protein IJ486_06180 [Firmicutes bacterium]|nr:hypothetical protein [Bacillota bacterium]
MKSEAQMRLELRFFMLLNADICTADNMMWENFLRGMADGFERFADKLSRCENFSLKQKLWFEQFTEKYMRCENHEQRENNMREKV